MLGRLAPFALEGEPADGRIVRRPFASGLLFAPWTLDELVLHLRRDGRDHLRRRVSDPVYFDLFIVNSPLGSDPIIRDSIIEQLAVGFRISVARA